MRENRITINITFWTTITTFIGATYFSFYNSSNTYMINLCFAVFGSSLLALIVALSGYFSAKKQVLKQYLDTLISVWDALGSYRKVTKNTEDILNNVDAVHAPKIPVITTHATVTADIPPISSDKPMAIAVVIDFGILVLHLYKLPFCERHRRGYETRRCFSLFVNKIVVIYSQEPAN